MKLKENRNYHLLCGVAGIFLLGCAMLVISIAEQATVHQDFVTSALVLFMIPGTFLLGFDLGHGGLQSSISEDTTT